MFPRSRPPEFRLDHGPLEAIACSCVAASGLVCGGTPFLHIVWEDPFTGEESFGFACTKHAGALEEYTPLQVHEPSADCGMPGSVWDFDRNTCCCEGEIGEETDVDAFAWSSLASVAEHGEHVPMKTASDGGCE